MNNENEYSVCTVSGFFDGMSEKDRRIFNEIAERNTAALEELMAMTPEQRANLKCTVTDIPNPFMFD